MNKVVIIKSNLWSCPKIAKYNFWKDISGLFSTKWWVAEAISFSCNCTAKRVKFY
ncbi:hypothetical protein GCM10017717_21570 [Deinococcus persicinus]